MRQSNVTILKNDAYFRNYGIFWFSDPKLFQMMTAIIVTCVVRFITMLRLLLNKLPNSFFIFLYLRFCVQLSKGYQAMGNDKWLS